MYDNYDHALLSEDGYFRSEKMLRLAEILEDFSPELELRWIPPDKRNDVDKSKPYCIVHIPSNRAKPSYVVMYVTELDDPVDVLARLWYGDTRRDDVLRKVEAREAAEKAFQMKKHMEETQEKADLFHFLMTNRSKFWTSYKDDKGNLVKLDDQRRRR